jgi:hypothetical protein
MEQRVCPPPRLVVGHAARRLIRRQFGIANFVLAVETDRPAPQPLIDLHHRMPDQGANRSLQGCEWQSGRGEQTLTGAAETLERAFARHVALAAERRRQRPAQVLPRFAGRGSNLTGNISNGRGKSGGHLRRAGADGQIARWGAAYAARWNEIVE